eukprot:GHVN01079223.1.p1 GENE.GHVN01079223.1~~GHVN01079223.1.p1  ORF type:complete len:488 (-),score=76.74 GHVN01079223.1:209-1672(-)
MNTAETVPDVLLENLRCKAQTTWKLPHVAPKSDGTGASCSADLVAVFANESAGKRSKKKKTQKADKTAVAIFELKSAETRINNNNDNNNVENNDFNDKEEKEKYGTQSVISPHSRQLRGHSAAVSDFEFSPHYDSFIATGSDDSTVKIWQVPEEESKKNKDISWPITTLKSHRGRVSSVRFNPIADDILATCGMDSSVKIWDLTISNLLMSVSTPNPVTCMQWSMNGNVLGSIVKPGSIAVIDGRDDKLLKSNTQPHSATGAVKLCWLDKGQGYPEKLATTGLADKGNSEIAIWDLRKMDSPVSRTPHPGGERGLYPHWDEGTGMLFVTGKGGLTVTGHKLDRDGSLTKLIEFSQKKKIISFCYLPKKEMNINHREIVRCLTQTSGDRIIANSITAPMDSEDTVDSPFDPHLYPPCLAGVPALSADEWWEGLDGEPVRCSLDPDALRPAKTRNKIGKQKTFLSLFTSKQAHKDEEEAKKKSSACCVM